MVAIMMQKPTYKELQERVQELEQKLGSQKRAEMEFIATKNRLIEAQEFAKLGWWEYNIAEDLITWSDQHYEMYGITHAEDPLRFESLMKLIPDEYHQYHSSRQFEIQ